LDELRLCDHSLFCKALRDFIQKRIDKQQSQVK
jgi:hypothetical protein